MCDQPDTLDDLIANCATYPADMAAEIVRLRAQREQLLAAFDGIRATMGLVVRGMRARVAIDAVEEKP